MMLFGKSMARRLPLGLHLLVQTVSLAMVVPYNGEVCSLVLQYPAAPRLLGTLDKGMRLIAALLPSQYSLPIIFAARVDGSQQQCMFVTSMLQVFVGFALPTAIIAAIEVKEVKRFVERCGAKPTSMRDRCLLWLSINVFDNCTPLVFIVLSLSLYSVVFLLISLLTGLEIGTI